jgi:hypothetical protein
MNETTGQKPVRRETRCRPAAMAFPALLAFLCVAALTSAPAAQITVNTPAELQVAAAQARPGDTLLMRDGVWNNADLLFAANGSNGAPVTLRAQTLGAVHLTGASRLRMAGNFLVVDGLVFTNGYRTAGDIIAFQDTTFARPISAALQTAPSTATTPPTLTPTPNGSAFTASATASKIATSPTR